MAKTSFDKSKWGTCQHFSQEIKTKRECCGGGTIAMHPRCTLKKQKIHLTDCVYCRVYKPIDATLPPKHHEP